MIALPIAAVSIAVFAFAFVRLRVLATARTALATTRDAVATIQRRDLDDDSKEAAMQQAGLALLAGAVSIGLRCTVVLLVSYTPIALAETAALTPQGTVLAFMLRWDVLLGVTVVMGLFTAGRARLAAS